MKNIFATLQNYCLIRKRFPEPLRDFLAPLPYSPIFLARHYVLQTLKNAIPFLRHGSFLDVGCGMKPYESLFKSIAKSYIGIDHPITQGGSYGTLTRADIFSDAPSFPFKNETFDSVICTQVLEHVSDPSIKVNEIARVLVPGGTAVISVPFAWPLHEVPYDFYRYTEFGLKSLLENSGLKVIHHEDHGNAMEALCQITIELYIAKAGATGLAKLAMRVVSTGICFAGICGGKLFPSRNFLMGFTMIAVKNTID